jgi:hypothetical protein
MCIAILRLTSERLVYDKLHDAEVCRGSHTGNTRNSLLVLPKACSLSAEFSSLSVWSRALTEWHRLVAYTQTLTGQLALVLALSRDAREVDRLVWGSGAFGREPDVVDLHCIAGQFSTVSSCKQIAIGTPALAVQCTNALGWPHPCLPRQPAGALMCSGIPAPPTERCAAPHCHCRLCWVATCWPIPRASTGPGR